MAACWQDEGQSLVGNRRMAVGNARKGVEDCSFEINVRRCSSW